MQVEAHSDDPLVSQKPSRLRRLLRWQVATPLILCMLAILAVVLFPLWRVSQVPDMGDPFPVSGILKPIPDKENAFRDFEEAFALLKEVDYADMYRFSEQQFDGWDPTAIELNKYLEMNRPAMEKWREATRKNAYQARSMTQVGEEFGFDKFLASRELVRWCKTEIERLLKTDKPAEVLPWLRASFRCSGLTTRNARQFDRFVGAAIFANSADSAEKWMHHPDVTRDQLLELLSVVQTSARLMETPSTTIKVNYLFARREYARWSYDDMRDSYKKAGVDPPMGSRFEYWLLAEPEYSRRLTAHVTANHLAFVDDPRRDRSPLLDGDLFD